MKITDAVKLGDARVTDDGYLEANARTARTGVQHYLGSEVGRPDLPMVSVYRDASEVFAKASLETFSKLPITVDHPSVMVDASNWRDLAVGTTGDDVLRDGEYLKIGLKITDASAVKAVRDGKRELSVGYICSLDWEAGVAPDGTPYQARQTGIAANHIAIVSAGRAGPEVRIGDAAADWGARPLTDAQIATTKETRSMTTRTIAVDGLSVEMADKDAQIVQRTLDGLHKKLADAEVSATKAAADHAKAISDKDAAHATAITAKDKEIATKDAEIDALKAKVLDEAALDKRVAARADLLAKAKSLAPKAAFEGLADEAIRRATVAAVLGDTIVTDKSQDYVDARFEILVEDHAKADPLRAAMQGRSLPTTDTRDSAHAAMVARMTGAYKEAKH